MNTLIEWYRSFPAPVALNRRYIVDELPRILIRDYDQRPIFDNAISSFVLLEWDIVLSRDNMIDFEQCINDNPNTVQVLPYQLEDGRWAHRHTSTKEFIPGKHVYTDIRANDSNQEFINENEPFAELFGIGAIYIPFHVSVAYRKAYQTIEHYAKVNDHFFSLWHWLEYGQSVPIHWNIRPIHLHW